MEVQQHDTKHSLAPVAGLASAIAMGVIIGYNMSRKSKFSSPSASAIINNNISHDHSQIETSNQRIKLSPSTIIRNRIFKTYAYFAGSIGITGLSAYYFFTKTSYSRDAMQRMAKHPNWYLFSSLITSIGLLLATKFTNYKKRPLLKHILWIIMQISDGALLSVLGFIGGKIIIKAMIYTACILGGISLISASSPDEKVLKLGGYLGIGLGFLCGMSLIEWVYPSAGKPNMFQNVNIYGGLMLFALQMAYDTKKVLIKAKQIRKEYDPINEQMNLYLNSVNFFLKLITLFLKKQEEERKKKDEEDEQRRQRR